MYSLLYRGCFFSLCCCFGDMCSGVCVRMLMYTVVCVCQNVDVYSGVCVRMLMYTVVCVSEC